MKNGEKKKGKKKTERGERERERKMKKDTRNETMRDERMVTEEWVKEEEEEEKKERAMASNTNMPRIFYSSSCEITNKTFGNTAAAVSFENNCILWTLSRPFHAWKKNTSAEENCWEYIQIKQTNN